MAVICALLIVTNRYMPLRQHLLTRLLKRALTDTESQAAVIATLSPAAADTEHSHNTLRHACQVGPQIDFAETLLSCLFCC